VQITIYDADMDEERKRDRLRSFVIGGIVGAGAVIAAGRRARPRKAAPRPITVGLAAFEDAPCYRELVDRERSDFEGS
jgi:hypothetical protein